MQNLPVSTVRQLRNTMRDSVRLYLQEHGADLIQALSLSVDWEHIADLIINVHLRPYLTSRRGSKYN